MIPSSDDLRAATMLIHAVIMQDVRETHGYLPEVTIEGFAGQVQTKPGWARRTVRYSVYLVDTGQRIA